MSDFLQPHELQHARLLCPPLSPRVWISSCPLSWQCYQNISASAALFFCLQFFTVSGSFPMSQLFSSGRQSIEVSASVLLMNIQDWFPLGLTGWISLGSKGLLSLLQHHSSKGLYYHSTYCICQTQGIRGGPSRLSILNRCHCFKPL